jgi:hypothetical protein
MYTFLDLLKDEFLWRFEEFYYTYWYVFGCGYLAMLNILVLVLIYLSEKSYRSKHVKGKLALS